MLGHVRVTYCRAPTVYLYSEGSGRISPSHLDNLEPDTQGARYNQIPVSCTRSKISIIYLVWRRCKLEELRVALMPIKYVNWSRSFKANLS
jgi:hypothetical protein